jgi:hypothetical protein
MPLLAWPLALALAAAAQSAPSPPSAPGPPGGTRPQATPRPAAKPQSVKALLALAHEQSRKKDLRGALETLRQARALAPNSEEVLAA